MKEKKTNGKRFSKVFTVAEAVICGIILAVGIYRRLAGGSNAAIINAVIIAAVVVIFFACVRSLRRSARRGEQCECCGDCSKCRIQCTTNEKYYGIQHPEKKSQRGRKCESLI